MRSNHSLSLAEARKQTPAITDAAACVIRLQGAVFDAIGEADVKEIMKGIVAKAKEGDLAAARVILDYCANPKVNYTRRDVTITQKDERQKANDVVDVEAAPNPHEMVMRRLLARTLAEGPLQPWELAKALKMTSDEATALIVPLLAPPWFASQGTNGATKWHLTSIGRKELLA